MDWAEQNWAEQNLAENWDPRYVPQFYKDTNGFGYVAKCTIAYFILYKEDTQTPFGWPSLAW